MNRIIIALIAYAALTFSQPAFGQQPERLFDPASLKKIYNYIQRNGERRTDRGVYRVKEFKSIPSGVCYEMTVSAYYRERQAGMTLAGICELPFTSGGSNEKRAVHILLVMKVEGGLFIYLWADADTDDESIKMDQGKAKKILHDAMDELAKDKVLKQKQPAPWVPIPNVEPKRLKEV